ncbi:DUF4136 domain-containing protein [Winogradskyella sp. DF17]|uniref:DUF4136 domain-containing protein n=1 Tax=Winogradskyella pelagia TaxID=2819984 RepID=A0ABS3T2W6_9FLAO|nr:DUF4136 domain-containing protein [Winogradskyella sp. DF17]MBO3116231.1 DUF4136 domain-containing protein [Winogradskyella sp. DF17]
MKTINLFLLVFLFSITINAQVKADYNKDTDFEAFKTYRIVGWQENSDKILNDFDKQRILNAINAELEARSMSAVKSNADLDITLFIVVQEKTTTTAYTTYNTGMGYRGRWGWGYGGMGSANTTYSDYDYKEGTFVMDMYNGSSKELVWQGVITSKVNEKSKKREKTIPKNVKKLMKKYPIKPKK